MKASENIDRRIASLVDWRGSLLAHPRTLILTADPNLTEGWKWSSPAWSRRGLVCSVGVFHGAALQDPRGLMNAGDLAKESRGIDLREVAEVGLQALS
ncbi:DUF1801 domain-containing protein [Deinococcus yavapaiensis]|uniref:YdhG-like domain-containing protein n=1 Tax=Deinococcus yavapaiensis KR-236 TaxID=694435 RepID=A0A318S472_9DEIO|nr:DUF1801 domain-containing protein [Deinococcus yavapaiensis]PYE53236.1 hypothetical protein DES52_1098 [Deinococcus yavapaiensis KR-236]